MSVMLPEGSQPLGSSCRQISWRLIAILGLAWVLRIVLAWRGGQFYFPDEGRYLRANDLVIQSFNLLRRASFLSSGFPSGYDELLRHPVHPAYPVMSMTGEVLRMMVGWLEHHPDYWVLRPAAPIWVSAAFLSLASVSVIALTYAVARRAGADEREGLLAAALIACSGSLFYYSRHFLPYDSALALALLAAWIGLRPEPGPVRSFLVGLCAGLAFLTYNGYWISALVAIGLHVAHRPPSLRGAVARTAMSGAGLAMVPALLTAATLARDLPVFYVSLIEFSRTIVQGEFTEGWSFPWEYLWHAEHGLLVLWLAGVVGVGWLAARGWPPGRSRGLLWLGAAAMIYLLLVIGSNILGVFVVYGRTVRQLVPYLCLATACAASSPWVRDRMTRGGTGAVLALVVLQFTQNAVQPLAQRFPGDVEQEIAAHYGPVVRASTFDGCCGTFWTDAFYQQAFPPTGNETTATRYVLLNTAYPYPVVGAKAPPAGQELLSATHPIQYFPYQYEGYGPAQRAVIRSTDVRMRLVELHPQEWDGERRLDGERPIVSESGLAR